MLKHAFWIFILLGFQLQAQHRISGQILDETGAPIPSAIVEIHELDHSYLTDFDGNFSITDIKPGNYHIHVSSIGFHYKNIDTSIVNQDIYLNITLEESINELHEVMIESSPFKDDQKSSSIIIQSVDDNYLKKEGGSTLTESLEQIDGVQSINTGVGVSKPVIRGFTGNRVIVNDAGIKQEGQQWGSDHGLEIDQYGVEKVEIIKGPAALAYGSDAIGGVINIKRNATLPQNTLEGDLSTVYRSYNNTYGLSVGTKGNINNNIFRVRLTGLNYADYKVPTDQYTYQGFILPIENGRLKNTAGEERHLSATVGINRKWGFSHLTASHYYQKVGFFPGATGVPRSYSLQHDGDYWDIDLPYQEVNHTKIISNNSFNLFGKWTELDVGYQLNHRQEHTKPHAHGIYVDPNETLATDLKLHTGSMNLKLHNKTFKTWESVYGIQSQIQINTIDGFDFIIPAYQDYRVGLYSLFRKGINKKTYVNFGLRLEAAQQLSDATDQPFFVNKSYLSDVERSPDINNTYLNYAAGFGISHNANDQASIKFNFGKTFRIPNMAELASNGNHTAAFRFEKGNPNLNPEEGYQFDLGFINETKKLHFSVNTFFNYFTNFIYLQPQPYFASETINNVVYAYAGGGQLYTYQQAEALHTGAEINIHYHISKQFALEIVGESVFGQNLETDLPLPTMPPPSIKTGLEFEKPYKDKTIRNFYTKLQHHYSAAQNRTDRNEQSTPSYHLLNLSFGMSFGKKVERFNINATIANLTNETYLNHLSRYRQINVPEPARNFSITATYTFGKQLTKGAK